MKRSNTYGAFDPDGYETWVPRIKVISEPSCFYKDVDLKECIANVYYQLDQLEHAKKSQLVFLAFLQERCSHDDDDILQEDVKVNGGNGSQSSNDARKQCATCKKTLLE